METAVRQHEHGELKAAAVTCQDFETLSEHAGALNLLGSILADAGNFDQAVNLLRDALVLGGANSGVLFNYGIALAGADRLVEAARAFKIAVEAIPTAQIAGLISVDLPAARQGGRRRGSSLGSRGVEP